jgi:hypothetical protein
VHQLIAIGRCSNLPQQLSAHEGLEQRAETVRLFDETVAGLVRPTMSRTRRLSRLAGTLYKHYRRPVECPEDGGGGTALVHSALISSLGRRTYGPASKMGDFLIP